MVLTLFSEVGRDMSRWPRSGNFVSWLALCPDNDIIGGRVASRGVRTVHNQAGETGTACPTNARKGHAVLAQAVSAA
jgi:hypothetical protein